MMAINLPPKHIFPAVFSFSRAAIQDPLPAARHGAILALLMIMEGCAAAARKKLQEVLQVGIHHPLAIHRTSIGHPQEQGLVLQVLAVTKET